MNKELILGKNIQNWLWEYPLLRKMIKTEEVFWINPKLTNFNEASKNLSLTEEDVLDARNRLERFAPYISKVFPETMKTKGIIESPLVEISNMKKLIENQYDFYLPGNLFLKCDSHLPISGSIKARGGIYEVLTHAEKLAAENNKLSLEDDYSVLDSNEFREFFSQYSIAVGSTGNLGLSIGIMSAKIGFNVTVHMSADAKQWKKDLLKSKGVNVIEYDSDYSKAVEEGRKQALSDEKCYFIDDENSKTLFLGYAVAASRLKQQLDEINIIIDKDHPLFVYLPCGVGGGPGGVAFGLKLIFKDNVHCFFGEPTHSPCMLLGLMTQEHDRVCVQDFGIDNITDADGLAVGRASGFVGKTLEHMISGDYTVQDETLYTLLKSLADSENIYLEPSALASIAGAINLFKIDSGYKYLSKNSLEKSIKNATHISWATGGSMVPKNEMYQYYRKGSLQD
ncbi:D-serine ammonia-lyase [Oceanirhabdus seepicola]|uniref:Probable D-serine dehydratase n=1 Tax=Oceanirhabdus seepicola TaxID=2828781 RepID=A0A9J6NWW8_9CLOT|nr:D-serine ammonia-lyase [Oceanirhabdus seepicola]MCM1988556.1 D-serine ammonia-lyase [Oceanirhabdus seepicola]